MKRNMQKLGVTARIEILKEIFSQKYTPELLNEIHQDLCKDLTFAFIFERKFHKKETGNDTIPFALKTEGEVFNLEDYEYVKDFLDNYTGNLEWDDETKDFETYSDLLFNSLSEDIDQTIASLFDEKVGKNAYDLLMIEAVETEEHQTEINNIFNSLINNIWTKFCTLKYSTVVAQYREGVYQEEFEMSQLRDSELEKQGTEAYLFQEIIEELIDDYDVNLMDYEQITKEDTVVLEALNEWAKTTTFDKIEIVEMCLSLKPNEMDDYKWLDKEIFAEKQKDFEHSVKRVDDFFQNLGIPVVEKKVSYQTVKLYSLLNAIFDVKGEKIVTIYGNELTKTYVFDEFNRVLKINGVTDNERVIEIYDDFLNDLSYQMGTMGTVIVKSLISKTAIRKNREVIEVATYEIRTAYLIRGIYTGLSKENAQKFAAFIQDSQTKYKLVDWDVGSRNITISIRENGRDFNEDDEGDEN